MFRKILVIGLILSSFALVLSADAAVRVKGYFRKDGTYVQPHYRSSPDSTTTNNYSYCGNINPYTGAVGTVGCGGSSGTYALPTYTPYPTWTPTPTTTCPANSYPNGSMCTCYAGYVVNATRTACIIATVFTPAPTPLSCGSGLALSLDKKRCVKIPSNAHIASDGKNVWLCDSGYTESGTSCIPDVIARIQSRIKENQAAYYKTPHQFREELVEALTNEFGSQHSAVVSRWVYTILQNTKSPATPAATVKSTPRPTPSQSSCNKNYSGCLMVGRGDYDCRGGSGNGPNYTGRVRVIGYDEYDLDRDGDGIGCE